MSGYTMFNEDGHGSDEDAKTLTHMVTMIRVNPKIPSFQEYKKADDDHGDHLNDGKMKNKNKLKQGYKILKLFGTEIPVPYNPDDDEKEERTVNSCDHPLNPLALIVYDPKQGSFQGYGAKGRKKRKAESHVVSPDGRKKRKPFKKRDNIDDLPKPSLDEFPRVQSILIQQGIEKPEFLYRKWIEESDINKDLNRLLLAKSESLMKMMTKEEEGKMLTEKDGFMVSGFDSEGRDYTLHFKKWKSQGQPILNQKSWKKLVDNNNVEEGQMIEIWGERRNHEPVFIINFRKVEVQSNAAGSSIAAGSSNAAGSSHGSQEGASN